MTHKELYDLLNTLGIPCAYNHFEGKVDPPFVAYTSISPEVFNADDYNYSMDSNYQVELITEKKDLTLEGRIEALFNGNHIPFEKMDDVWDDSERIYIITYEI